MSPASVIAEVKRLNPLPTVVSDYVKLRPVGKRWTGLCPFHDDSTPSLSVHNDFFTCFGCGAKGDVFNFLQMIEGISFQSALEQLAERCGLPLDGKPVSRAVAATDREDRLICLWWWEKRREAVMSAIDMAIQDDDESLAECLANVRRWIDAMPPADRLHYFRCHSTGADRREYSEQVRDERIFADYWMALAQPPTIEAM